jgi:hypothetical protein
VPCYVRKLAFCRDAMPAPLDLMLRALNRGRRMLAGMTGMPARAQQPLLALLAVLPAA